MGTRQSLAPLRRLEARFWTGPIAHLLGGGIDLAGAVVRAALIRRRSC